MASACRGVRRRTVSGGWARHLPRRAAGRHGPRAFTHATPPRPRECLTIPLSGGRRRFAALPSVDSLSGLTSFAWTALATDGDFETRLSLSKTGCVQLPQPRTAAGADGLAALRSAPSAAVIGLDFDGTLAPIVDDPAAARAHPAAASVLARLAPLVHSIVIVTGRPAAVAIEYGGFAPIDGLVVLGQYGLERWEGGRLTAPDPPPGVAEARTKLPPLLAAARAPAETFIEDKGQALAVHTRRCAEPQVALDRLRSVIEALAVRTGLVVEPGRFVLELRPPGVDKGLALRRYVAERPAARAVLYAGDDLGDLAAFDAVDALRAGGIAGVTVCSGSVEVAALADRADILVDGPDGVIGLLDALAVDLG